MSHVLLQRIQIYTCRSARCSHTSISIWTACGHERVSYLSSKANEWLLRDARISPLCRWMGAESATSERLASATSKKAHLARSLEHHAAFLRGIVVGVSTVQGCRRIFVGAHLAPGALATGAICGGEVGVTGVSKDTRSVGVRSQGNSGGEGRCCATGVVEDSWMDS